MRLHSAAPVLAILLLFLANLSYRQVTAIYFKAAQETNYDEVLYLPSGEGLEAISFGYKNVLSHVLWFNTINYFGKHYKGDRNYQWLYHMCKIVTQLNPKATHVYDFCGLMLAWEASLPDKALDILNSAILNNPQEWKFPYLRGMTHLLFTNDVDKAKNDFIAASKLPNVHPGVIRLAAKKLSLTENPDTAINFLHEMIQNSKQEWERQALVEKIRDIQYTKDIITFKQAIEMYSVQNGKKPTSLEDLVEKGIITELIPDPWGGKYSLDLETGEILSSGKTDGKKQGN